MTREGTFAGNRGLDDALALELVPVTEAAALAAGRWAGHSGESARLAAVDATHTGLRSVPMRGAVVLGAGARGETPALFHGAEAGDGDGPECDLGISVGDGALSESRDVPCALTAIAVAERGAMLDPSPELDLEKLVVGPGFADVVDITRPVAENLRMLAAAKGVRVSDVVVAVLNRPRHGSLAREIRDAGARVHLLEGGEIAGAVATARAERQVDLLLGTGNAAEGVIAAAALACLGGSMQARLVPKDAREHGTGEVLRTEDLVRGERVLFCATGVTSSELLRGIRNDGAGRAIAQSIVLCSNPVTVRTVRSEHRSARQSGHG
ncbi:fructose-bisphosphatase class II [Amycolatopsis saalfeldensis]|uniref:Fructose-1,6-bisphosphatase n=1 Tax=Amycolatopsis saalfeldensis TaxID=394193 RepID=A0A1H8YQU1_9PSEU|nr:fructose-bisphosphatase class II [Amycolatopsis saalfeldensis]SEP54463.1 fructose-1,6-bisphosphatase II [Amycolatopsis saalfeldensis]